MTGGSRGLGRAIALRFGRSAWNVAVVFNEREDQARRIADRIVDAGGDAAVFRADLRDPRAIEEMVREVRERWDAIDVLVNNAGVTRDGLAIRMSDASWDEVLSVDLSGPFRVLRAVAAVMAEQGGGHIINIASISAVQGREGQANYSSAKAGLIGLTKAAARELGGSDIKVNAVLPGFLGTEMGSATSDDAISRIVRENALGRISDPEEAAEFIYRLSLMRNVSGQVFNLDSRVL